MAAAEWAMGGWVQQGDAAWGGSVWRDGGRRGGQCGDAAGAAAAQPVSDQAERDRAGEAVIAVCACVSGCGMGGWGAGSITRRHWRCSCPTSERRGLEAV